MEDVLTIRGLVLGGGVDMDGDWLYGLHGNLHRRGGGAGGLSDRNREGSACWTNWGVKG